MNGKARVACAEFAVKRRDQFSGLGHGWVHFVEYKYFSPHRDSVYTRLALVSSATIGGKLQQIGGNSIGTSNYYGIFLSFSRRLATSLGPNQSGTKHSELDVNRPGAECQRRRRFTSHVGRLFVRRNQNNLHPLRTIHGAWTRRHLRLHAHLSRQRTFTAGRDYGAWKRLVLHFLG